MRTSSAFFLFIFICAVPRIGQAQAPATPEKMVAIGADFGVLATSYGDGSKRETGDAYLEYYITPRASVRGLYGWARTDLEAARELHRQHVLLNVLYNWELGRVRPFATVGGGAYFLKRQDGDQAVGETLTKPGGHLGAGVEYRVRRFAVKTEVNAHLLNGEERFPELRGETPSGFSWTVGVKVPF